MSISFKTDLCMNKPHVTDNSALSLFDGSLEKFSGEMLIKRHRKLQSCRLSVCLQEYSLIWVGTRGMSESRLILKGYCRIFVITAACEQSSTCFCRDHTHIYFWYKKQQFPSILLLCTQSICFSLICLSPSCNYLSLWGQTHPSP